MAPENDGEVFWFGQVHAAGFINLEDYVELDEDLSTGEADDLAPWMRVTASVPEGTGNGVDIQYIYYQTSQQEEIVGGKTNADYTGVVMAILPQNLRRNSTTLNAEILIRPRSCCQQALTVMMRARTSG